MKLPLYITFQVEQLEHDQRAVACKRLNFARATTHGCQQGGVSLKAAQKHVPEPW